MAEPKAKASPRISGNGIGTLISELGSKNKAVREKARDALLAMGESAVGALVGALADPGERVRWEAGKLLDEINVAWTKHASTETVKALISDLGSKDGLVRVRARRALVAISDKAVSPLVEAMASKDAWQRWEAAKALCEIGDPTAIRALVSALEDEMFDVRWLAAEGLITIGRAALVPLLREIIKRPDALWLREGSHRILHGILREENKQILYPVLKALEGPEPVLKAPFAAKAALEQMEKG